ncbi:alcohol dehydrogenase catalytic domain-containing protein [Paenibacillus foliorum]|uniref:alcohol dehydrogenase catalytic domain-containing protein n=1 Tax=Paenibacillus foliorum TaxID=2654974 RepID=UPI001492ACE6|nr:alcohol dehydrogenase catalytic domain-containing protein [Paenibacillus foliorum]
MKALVFYAPGDVRVVDRPEPIVNAGEVLIKVAAAGLCGTDRHIADGSYTSAKSMVLGHELAGVIQEVGHGVEHISVGTRVCVDPNLGCHSCNYCRAGKPHLCLNAQAVGVTRDGGLASYVSVPAELCHPLPEGLSPVHAILGEPLSCVVHALDRANIELGSKVAIWGLGTSGIMMIQCLRAMGQPTIIGVSHHEDQRNLALRAGATQVMTQEEAKQSLEVDLAIEASGSPSAFEPAFNALAPGGRMLLYGVMSPGDVVSLKPEQMFRRELTLIGSYVGPRTLDRALSLLAARIVEPEMILGDRLNLEEAREWVLKEGARKRAKAYVVFE